jgi:hypothetical protein
MGSSVTRKTFSHSVAPMLKAIKRATQKENIKGKLQLAWLLSLMASELNDSVFGHTQMA